MDLRERLRVEVIVRRMAVSTARARLKQEEREANKERRQVPEHLRVQLMRAIKDAEGNVDAAVASLEGVNRFPPIRRTA